MEHRTLLKGLFAEKGDKKNTCNYNFARFHLYFVQGYASDCLGVEKDKNLGKGFDLLLVMGTGKYVSLCSPFINIWIFVLKSMSKEKLINLIVIITQPTC